MTPQNKRDLYPYALITLVAAALFFLLLLDRRYPVFPSSSGMIPFFFIVTVMAALLTHFATRTPAPKSEDTARLWLQWHRSGPIGGALTGFIFFVTYWAYDWPAPNRAEISERIVNEMCALSQAVADEQIIWTTPEPWGIIPGFMFIGMALGLAVGFLFPYWHNLWSKKIATRASFRWLSHPYPSGLTFGMFFGALIGIWLCPIIFSINDGRPFIRLSTSAISVFLAVSFYLLFEVARHRHSMNPAAYTTLATVLLVSAIITSLVWFLDAQLGISKTAYCFFYTTWNTELDVLKPGWQPAMAGAVYGAMCGAITMSITSGYLIIRTAIASTNEKVSDNK